MHFPRRQRLLYLRGAPGYLPRFSAPDPRRGVVRKPHVADGGPRDLLPHRLQRARRVQDDGQVPEMTRQYLPVRSFETPVPSACRAPRIASATDSSGTTRSTAPRRMACLGMPKTTQLASSWAIVVAPADFIFFIPCAPSEPIPVRITPIAFGPAASATELNSTSTDGR